MASATRRSAFTLVEMLVVISIIGVLAAMLMPAIQAARETTNKARCLANLTQLSKAVIDFEGVRQRYPGYREQAGGQQVPWTVAILDHMEQGDLYDQWRESLITSPPGNQLVPSIEFFVCPSDPNKLFAIGPLDATLPTYDRSAMLAAQAAAGRRFPPLSYVANAGMYGAVNYDDNERPENGIFHDFYNTKIKTTTADMYDGLSTTLLFSENMQAGSWIETDVGDGVTPRFKEGNVFVWHPKVVTDTWTIDDWLLNKINGNKRFATLSKFTARPSAAHSRGVNVAFADGHTIFLREGIDPWVYEQLMTPHGSTSDMSDPAYVLKSPDYE